MGILAHFYRPIENEKKWVIQLKKEVIPLPYTRVIHPCKEKKQVPKLVLHGESRVSENEANQIWGKRPAVIVGNSRPARSFAG